MTTRVPAEVFPPGEFIQEELEERGWTQSDFAEIIGRSRRLVTELVNGKRGVTPETAVALADAFGTSADLWLNLESAYRLSRVESSDSAIIRKTRIYSIAPIKDMTRRGWIEPTHDVELLESQIVRFFDLRSIDQDPKTFPHAARKSTRGGHVNDAQKAWLHRSVNLSRTLTSIQFRPDRFNDVIGRLKQNLQHVHQVGAVPNILSEGGIRFLVVEHLPNTRIDGACFWLDENSPVVALSMRYDRIDYFWHTLMHELGHIQNRHGKTDGYGSLDIDIVASDQVNNGQIPGEVAADQFAVEALAPLGVFQEFIDEFSPYYSKQRVLAFTEQCGVHPALIVGQLQRRKELTYSQFRGTLERVRDVITSTALTDGWGYSAPIT